MDTYKDIRPYRDHEVREVLDRLLQDDAFIATLSRFRFPRLSRWFSVVLHPLVRTILKRELAGVIDVHSLQEKVESYVDRTIRKTTTSVSYEGLDRLQSDRPYLFMANHRDIVMDPTFVNFAVYHQGLKTPHIAIGDNLLKQPFVSDLMRLNKSFIVNRSAQGRREKLAAFQQLSGYINHTIADGDSIWIAQREGRAKDGNDQTDSAIIKMLTISQKGQPFNEVIERLHIVPVSISYEFDPCDGLKAKELYETEQHGSYSKEEGEDDRSIVAGIVGFKGRVHLAFGEPLGAEYEDAKQVAAEVDRHMWQSYRLFPINYLAFKYLQADYEDLAQVELTAAQLGSKAEQADFEERLRLCPVEHRDWWLKMYAAPVVNRLRSTQAN
ncbi:1-acyl-sn-glycerol-3-phosphate acyltransferase [Aestuariirhabdus sp. Z084]|uniref:1-acyl-sn-glycerol-3-phosphate acyltransferase n=1 Tax=Aestuariirhabdus haliotis TaxID=2918751 RepID=UPI00201B3640|nr:1-acyl-sn-glycerol-3-phosphate acyltransferase [Aestuariirhabdus haliotis]MCL6417483.1 1-acyl-sn-glycerol-3-phosphate acyltransferase [Aestuariirhabdus haliotis]MCL6421431.1 1-acyl-sn-glycerol-3-phosphate acyltransferase [Aestuariirhabdus haliotis]